MGIFRLLFGVRRGRRKYYGRPNPARSVETRVRSERVVVERGGARVELRQVQTTTVEVNRPLVGACYVIDGDTIDIRGTRIRIAGIDAPELNHPWGQKSKWAMVSLCKGQTITAHPVGELSHDRIVARCFLPDGRDLAAELVKMGLALDWPKYSGGRYRDLEPLGVRKRLWRAHQRQFGRMVD